MTNPNASPIKIGLEFGFVPNGGGGGIRTHGPVLSRSNDFE